MKKKVNKLNVVRLVIQLIFLVISPIIFSFGFNGIKTIVTNISSGNYSGLTTAMKLGIIITIFTFMFGRFFCGWICAFGTYNDLLYLIGKRFIKIKNVSIEKIDKYLKLVKYIILCSILLLCAFGLGNLIYGKSPWDVFGMIIGFNFNFNGYIVGLIILILISIGCLFIERFFCRYLCPLGAIFSLVDRLNVFELHKPSEKCGKCRICTNECAMGINLYKDEMVKSGECIKCYKCTSACPRRNFKVKIFDKEIKNKYIIIGVVLVIFIILSLIIGAI